MAFPGLNKSLAPGDLDDLHRHWGFFDRPSPRSTPKPEPHEMTLKEIGAVLGITHQAVAEIEKKALRKLRARYRLYGIESAMRELLKD
jgi:hypothetical protein